ncbi:AAA family ATPase, partial [Candidatus Acetothermia bacterium]|nr:AAA family ATPase [Candidatus Acetothermia bacterium]
MADIIEINRHLEKTEDKDARLDDLSPAQIVAELDKYIIGQAEAKKAVAIALRNRLRRQRVQGDIKEEITPKNILMIGPTGVGKTEISRRLALLTNCPFLKVEATKFTEIGYVGRDVDSMIRDLAEASINMVKQEEIKRVEVEAKKHVEEKLLDALVGAAPPPGADPERKEEREESWHRTREKFRERLRGSELEETPVEIMA